MSEKQRLLIDSHAHVASDAFNEDRDAVYMRAQEAGVVGWIEVGTTVNESRQAIDIAKKYEGVWATVGVHPDTIADLKDDNWRDIEVMLRQEKVRAIGEVGLDFYRGGKREDQEPVLQRFIALAQEYVLPVVFHVRDGDGASAHDALIDILASYADKDRPRGVIHTFSGNESQAKKYLELGLYLSFSGVVTFKNAGSLLEVASSMPLEKMLIETDCPFLTPDPHRGQRNEPSYVRFVAEKIAVAREEDVSVVANQTYQNTVEFFRLN